MRKVLLIATITISACTSYSTAPLPMPQRVAMPTLTDAELECVSDSTYKRIVQRDIAHKQYQGRLESVIKSTRGGK